MPSSRRMESATFIVLFALLSINFAFKFVSLIKLYHAPPPEPINGGVWDVERKPVAFQFDSGLHYGFNASAAWRALVPGTGHIYLPSPTSLSDNATEPEPFMVSMFHQLRCLDVLRAQLALPRAERTEQPARHCMNYIRQMVLCRGDTHLDPYQYPSNVRPVDANPIRRCRDWRAVYEAVDANQREYAEWAAAAAATGRGRSASSGEL
ncbi:hypothetical protein C8Q77DRAFT_1218934 [Trametes polyzona]|nr:hypothetical protein C8Q77DRAFT_1218934 [Trametes polyzona]